MYYYSTFAFDHKSEFDKQHKRGSLILKELLIDESDALTD